MRKKMNTIAALVAAGVLSVGLVACGSGGGSSESSSDSGSSASAAAETTSAKDRNGGKEFEVKNGSEGSRVVTTTYVPDEGQVGTYEQDDNGNFHTIAEIPGQGLVEVYLVDGTAYNCLNQICSVDPSLTEIANQTDMLQEYENKLKEAKEKANYVGEQPCSAGQCEVWEVDKETYFLDGDKRIVKIEAEVVDPITNEPRQIAAEVEYKPVTITAPQV